MAKYEGISFCPSLSKSVLFPQTDEDSSDGQPSMSCEHTARMDFPCCAGAKSADRIKRKARRSLASLLALYFQ